MKTNEFSRVEKRSCIEAYLQEHVVGPKAGDEEILNVEPSNYYMSGILFPVDRESADFEEYLSLQEVEGKEEDSDVLAAEQVSTLSGKIFPSSMGIHAMVRGSRKDILIKVRYAIYKQIGKGWKRKPVEMVPIKISELRDHVKDIQTPEGPGYVRIVWNEVREQIHLKIYLVNDGRIDHTDTRISKNIYQPSIQIECCRESHFLNIIRGKLGKGAIEEKISSIQFRKHLVYAKAYGCSADWEESPDKFCRSVYTTFLPHYEIPPLTYEIEGIDDVLSQFFLSYELSNDENRKVINALDAFADKYESWVEQQSNINSDVDKDCEEYKVIIDNGLSAVSRIREGIRLIENESKVRDAFALTNLAMIMQSANRQSLIKYKQGQNPWRVCANLDRTKFAWRPFQLAFILMSLPPAFDNKSKHRDFVDLIWFPTGGGKTEAYLGVVAFSILLQRLRNPSGKFGTTVISRYTMRLLTAQQFERASALIAILHIMSLLWPKQLGGLPVTLGIWHGLNAKNLAKAEEMIAELLENDNPLANNPFPISKCPVCNSPLLPERKVETRESYRYSIQGKRMIVSCSDPECALHSGIPVLMVDDQIYAELPTMLIGTIDKFARLTWKEEPGWLLTGKNGNFPTPSLIIQDELHLIAGPLGSLAGVYETAIDALCATGDCKPQIIASTATVRRADEQCRCLYGRCVRQFPPPGLDEADSYFSRKDFKKPGRRYLGILAAHLSPTTAAVRIHSIMLQASIECQREEEDDAYWTLVSYFNSLKELGVAATLAADDIPDRLSVIEPDRTKRRQLKNSDFIDLYSERTGAELNEIMRQLNLPRSKGNSLGLLLTTNIISVGIDVDRLGYMLVNGQPKSTAEYIQASSRVGRTQNMPGLIVTLYGASKPRDRSHFENFVAYHSTIYGSVEPTSVTPFSKPSRERALHAIIVILARNLVGGIPSNGDAQLIKDKPHLINEISNIIRKRVQCVAPDEEATTMDDVRIKLDEWTEWAVAYQLYYEANSRQLKALLHREISPQPDRTGWRTMDSMRSVDFDTRVIIQGDPKLSRNRSWVRR